MRRKVLKHFAYMLPQRFLDLPSGFDLARFVKLGVGTLTIDFLNQRCRHDGHETERFETCEEYLTWIRKEMVRHHIDESGVQGIEMKIEFTVSGMHVTNSYWHRYAHALFSFDCASEVRTDEKVYSAHLSGAKRWGFDYYWDELYGSEDIKAAQPGATDNPGDAQ